MKRYFLDAALLLFFLLTMSFHFLPRILHEVFGLIMFAVVIWHLIINRRWFTSLSKSKLSRKKIFFVLINFSTLIIFMLVLVTGIFMSNYIFNDVIPLEIRRNMTIHQLHVSLPYILMILISLHIGLHWHELWQRFTHFTGLKIYKAIRYIFLIMIICSGIYGSFLNRVGDRILMKHIFATPATELSLGIFLLLFLSTMAIYVAIIFWINKKYLR